MEKSLMGIFSIREKRILEDLFQMSSGYVLDFSNASFEQFVMDSIGINIYQSPGYEEYISKAKKLRQLWNTESKEKICKLTLDLLDYCEDQYLKEQKQDIFIEKKIAEMRSICIKKQESKLTFTVPESASSTAQSVPIFVGSTFEDLQVHRMRVREALNRLMTHVHGMEQFGASPEMPLDKCLREVSKCQIYVGIFAMRYGSIPDGYDKSFTHLEYEKAQELGIPSLIFIQREDVLLLPQHIDLAEKSQKLKQLKQVLRKKHTCDEFSNPDELAAKVATAVANELMKPERNLVIQGNIQEALQGTTKKSAADIIKLFQLMPIRWQGVQVRGKFKINLATVSYGCTISTIDENICSALGIEPGHGIMMSWLEDMSDQKIKVVAGNGLADQLAVLSGTYLIEAIISPVIVEYCNNFCEQQTEHLYRLEQIISLCPYNITPPKPEDIPF